MTTLMPSGSRTPLVERLAWLQGPIAFPLIVFVTARLINVFMIVTASKGQIALDSSTMRGVFVFEAKPADPGYWGVITNWDGQWYQAIASDGYKRPLAGDPELRTKAWAWAFPPFYPLLVGFVMSGTGLAFGPAASVVSLTAGALGHVVLYRYLSETGGRYIARAGVVTTSAFISAPLFQAAYSEGLAFLLLIAALLMIRRRAYWWCLLPVTALSFTRLITPVLAVVLVVHLLSRARAEGWSSIPVRAAFGSAVLGVWSVAGALAWPALASNLMGSAARFNRASGTLKGLTFSWFTQIDDVFGAAALSVVPLLLLLLGASALDRRFSGWGLEMRTWSVAYPLYIFLLTPMGSGIIRYALLAPSLGLLLVNSAAARQKRLVAIAGGVCLGLLCQWWFIKNALVISSVTPLMVV
ncbi:hypothetical protein [Knoellia sp. p5-6-4]|uniref:hypothetical protein n=1 Tax=unclassified Knoellia TaxID=2618719 RepID=UPI0023DB1A99|nr:hypothetical protein [Knoellia sp. p5-6-4]MDF2146421.1 hypothetical protein [Knoellia sp. p5-6-4]